MISSNLAGSRVTVAGAAGFIGTNLIERLLESGCKVRGLIHNNPPQILRPEVDYVEADLTKEDQALRALQDTDIFVMAAANSSGAAVMESRPLVHLTPNVVMNAVTLDAAYQNGVEKYCFISSNTVYPESEHPMDELAVTGHFFDKYQVVAEMKWFSEKMVSFYSTKVARPMKTLIVRPGNLYGPFDKFAKEESKVVPAIIRRALERDNPFLVWGDGSDVKDFLYISDFVDAMALALASDEENLTLNIASGDSVVLTDIIQEVLRLTGHGDALVKYDLSKPTMIPTRLINVQKMIRLLGWAPSVGLVEGLRLTIDWYSASLKAGEGEPTR